MPPLGLLLTLVGVLLVRQVMVGRVKDIPTDARELALALVGGDTAAVRDVLTRRGENVATPESGVGRAAGVATSELGKECQRLGTAAQGYVLGSTGPDYYDCSGLIWRAMKNLGIYQGSRFTTSTWNSVAGAQGWQRLDSPVEGCVIVWPTRHMGVSLGGDKMYSARSSSKGIGVSTVSGDSDYFGVSADFWQVSGVSVPRGR
jgi:NlpC/P60 family